MKDQRRGDTPPDRPQPPLRPIDAAQAGIAPRILAAWLAMLDIVADGEWHHRDELVNAATATGITARTANNILRDARRSPRRFDTNSHRRPTLFRLPPDGIPW